MALGLLLGWGQARAGFFSLSEVKPGLEGFALTAGANNVISRFPVRVESVFNEAGQDFPLILVRASGPFIEASGGIAAGMSGSPVYFDNRLAGAISAGFPNADHKLGLVTPIEVMAKALPAGPTGTLERYGFPRLGRSLPLNLPGLGTPVPLAAPLAFTGFTGRATQGLLEALRARGANLTALPVQGRGAGSAADRPYKLEPGAPVSAQLITGDLIVGAVGTVTHVDGKNLLAFGHPVLGDARARYAAAPAFVNAIVPAQDIPFKLAENVAKPFGTLTTDRPYGVGGTSGSDPGFLPLELSVRAQNANRAVKVGLAPIESFVGALTFATGLSVLDQALEGSGPGSAVITWTLSFTDRNPVSFRDRVADPDDLGGLAARRLATPVALLAENPFQSSGLRSLRASIEVQPFVLSRLVRVEPETRTVKPGQNITLNVRLQPYRTAPVVRRLSVRIPTDAPEGPFRLIVRGGLTPRPDDTVGPRDPWEGILSFDDLLERLKNRLSGENILVETEGNGVAGTSILAFDAQTTPVSGSIPVTLSVQKEKP